MIYVQVNSSIIPLNQVYTIAYIEFPPYDTKKTKAFKITLDNDTVGSEITLLKFSLDYNAGGDEEKKKIEIIENDIKLSCEIIADQISYYIAKTKQGIPEVLNLKTVAFKAFNGNFKDRGFKVIEG